MNQPNLQIQKVHQCLQSLDQFTSTRINQDPLFSEVNQVVQNITNNSQNKLTVKIFSQFSILGQACYNFLSASQSLPQLYEFTIVDLPHNVQAFSQTQPVNSTLTLQANPEAEQPEYIQELNNNQCLLIGRDKQKLSQDYRSQNGIILDLPTYKKVSSIHAEISVKPYSNPPVWQIIDQNSRNGTFVNDQKINHPQILTSGDIISLAYESSSHKAPKFIFQAALMAQNSQKDSLINDGELIVLLINPQELFNDREKELIEQVSQNQILGLIIIPEFSVVNNEQISQQVNTNLIALKQWLNLNYSQLETLKLIEISPLDLQPFFTHPPSSVSNPNLQQIYTTFYNALGQIAKVKSGTVFLNQKIQQINLQINRLEQYYQKQADSLASEFESFASKLSGRTIEDSQHQLRINFRQVNEDREDYFKESRKRLDESKSALINGFSPFSFITSINAKVEQLEPFVTKESGQVGITLTKQGQNSHDYMVQVIKSQLGTWVEQEWEQIINKLNILITNSYQTLNFMPSFSLTNTFRSSNQYPNSHKILQNSFVATKNTYSYHQNSFSKDLLSGGIPIAIQGGFFTMSAIAGSPYAIIQGASLISSLSRLVGGILSRPQIEKNKLEEVITYLKQQNSQYYQRLAHFLADGLFREMINTLDNEEMVFKRSLNRIDDQLTEYFKELIRYNRQYLHKNQLLQKEIATFEQIKRKSTELT